MENDEIEEVMKKHNVVVWKPEKGSIVKGYFKGVETKEFDGNSVNYYVLQSEDITYLVKQYGWLVKHWSADIQIGDRIGIRCKGYFDNGPSRRGYIFDLLWGHKTDETPTHYIWEWL